MTSCHDMLMWSNIIHAHSSYRYLYWPERGPLDLARVNINAKCIGSESVRHKVNNKYSSDHLKTSLYNLLCCLHFNVCLHCFYCLIAACVKLDGQLISTNTASSVKNVLISAWFFRAAYSSLKECHQSEIIKCTSNYPVLSCDALAKITPSKRGMQTALDDVLHGLLLMIMIGAPIKYVSNQRSPNMMSYPSRSIIWSVLL